jgi:hypothetical protein
LSQSDHNDDQQQQPNKVIEASGHFANNQIENGTVTWIQGGLWNLEIYDNSATSNSTNGTASMNNNITYTADFLANFTTKNISIWNIVNYVHKHVGHVQKNVLR